MRLSLWFSLLYRFFLPNWVTNNLIYNKKAMVSPSQPYIVLWVESLSKNRNLFDIGAPGSKETAAFQAEAFGKRALYFLYECPTNVQNAGPVLSWTLSKQDFVCSRCCCSNTFLETSNKKRCSTGKRCWIYSSAKITLFLSPTPLPPDTTASFSQTAWLGTISWVKPSTCTEDNRTDKNKQTEISHIGVAVSSSSQAHIPLGDRQKGMGRGNTNPLHPALEDVDNLLLLKSGTKQANSASVLELETVRIGGLIPGSTKSRSIKQSSAPLC